MTWHQPGSMNPTPRSSQSDLGAAAGNHPAAGGDEAWARAALREVALAAIEEQRRARRWNMVFRVSVLVYLTVFLVLPLVLVSLYEGGAVDLTREEQARHTAVVEVHDVIADDSDANAADVIDSLRQAFENTHSVGVILSLNSPGGSPVQSGLIHDEIIRLRNLHPDKPVHAVVTDLCASGCYYIAAAADQIHADKASLVGSIGVRFDNFGFVEAIQKLGVERRLLTAGEHKGLLDPFLPVDPLEQTQVQSLLDEIHQQFISVVKTGRGDRLKDDPLLFSGMIWSGERAVGLGLVDGINSLEGVAREEFEAPELVVYEPEEDLEERLSRLFGLALASGLKQLGVDLNPAARPQLLP